MLACQAPYSFKGALSECHRSDAIGMYLYKEESFVVCRMSCLSLRQSPIRSQRTKTEITTLLTRIALKNVLDVARHGGKHRNY